MDTARLQDNLSYVAYGEDAWRMRYRQQGNRLQIRYDVHDMSAKKAKSKIRSLIAVTPCTADICIVHGYTHGTAIKDMIQTEQISRRIMSKGSPEYNPGITWMNIADRAGFY